MANILERMKVAKAVLEAQLKSGLKPNKFGTTKEKKANPRLPLTDKDRARIETVIGRLEKKIYEDTPSFVFA